jgi:hypothetical protein
MTQKQINLTMPKGLLEAAEAYTKRFGYGNIQELATECIRERVFFEEDVDTDLTPKEIELIERFIEATLSKPELLTTRGELDKALRE